jgi:hypothetical protein
MKRAIVTLSAFLLSASLAAAVPWIFKESPLDGIVEFTEELKSGTAYRHFINTSHITHVSSGSSASMRYSSIDITISAIKPARRRGAASTNVKHHLRFET